MFKYVKNQLTSRPNLIVIIFCISALFGLFAMFFVKCYNSQNYTLLFFECFSGIVILHLWESIIRERPKGQGEDLGLFYLALALFIWTIGDNIKIWDCENSDKKWYWYCFHNCVSTINSIFFLLSIKYLELKKDVSIKIFKPVIQRAQLIKADTLIFSGISIIVMNVIFAWYFGEQTEVTIGRSTIYLNLAGLPDAFLSFVTISLLLLFFYEVFAARNLEIFNYLTIFTGFTIVIAQISGFYSIENNNENIEFYISVIGGIYRPLLIALFFVLSLSWLWHEKEKMAENRRKDMNHAIRGTLLLLNKDISRKVEKYSDNFKMYLVLNEFKVRVKAMSNLHNEIHNVESKDVALKPLAEQCLREIKKALGYENMPLNVADAIKDLKCQRASVQKILAILLELSINANKVAHEEGLTQSEKYLEISVIKEREYLVIIVADNGRLYDKTQIKEGYGSRQLYAILKDLNGYIEFSENNINGRKGTTFKVVIPLNKMSVSQNGGEFT